MGKVICFYTRREITELPSTVAEGEVLIEHLLRFELGRSDNPFASPVEMIDMLISMVENNSGASRYNVMDRIYNAERKV
jgi:hypothetical protein